MAQPVFETLLYDVADGIATITLNRPDRLNAFTPKMMLDMIAAFDATDADDAVKAVIVTGAGRGFCAGADLGSGGATFGEGSREAERRAAGDTGDVTRDGGGRLTLRIFQSLKPVIAAVNGAAVGVGATMQLPMDIRLASREAKFGFVFSRRGIALEACSSWFLPRLVGPPAALEWCYSGRIFGAEEAHRRGLVQALHAPEDLLPAARSLAAEFVQNAAPVSMAVTRQLIWRGMVADHPMDAHRAESRSMRLRGASDDAKEGIASFLDKRAPDFPDRVSAGLPDLWPEWREPEYR
ncbi:crotonase/enoyl-CoA hydratase family protein [Phenylobacterium sp.]|uniref:crotonase/enoyl-CoA hydratase family protein n=1 Tax=Phenylobacterium sp. TaxID=1871053 RepID=UPI00301C53C6